jgi:hypothetical protein
MRSVITHAIITDYLKSREFPAIGTHIFLPRKSIDTINFIHHSTAIQDHEDIQPSPKISVAG